MKRMAADRSKDWHRTTVAGRICFSRGRFGIGEGRRPFPGHARGPAPHAPGPARMAADSRSRRASFLRANAWRLRAKTPPRHGAFSPRPGGGKNKLDERKTARAALAGGRLLRHVRRPNLACVAWIDSRPRRVLALARAGEPRQRAWRCLGRVDLQTPRQGQDADRGIESEADPEAELIWVCPQLFALKAASSASIISVMICSKVVSGCQLSRRLALAAFPTRWCGSAGRESFGSCFTCRRQSKSAIWKAISTTSCTL